MKITDIYDEICNTFDIYIDGGSYKITYLFYENFGIEKVSMFYHEKVSITEIHTFKKKRRKNDKTR